MVFTIVAVGLKCAGVLGAVAFVTLFERKVLGYSQDRVGPTKVSLSGLAQPIIDGMKLLAKELFFPARRILWGVLAGPGVGFVVMGLLWTALPAWPWVNYGYYLAVSVMVLIGLSVYSGLVAGWSGVSKFSVLGGVRGCSQAVSYEISLVVLLFCPLLLFVSVGLPSEPVPLIFASSVPIFLSCIAETNRAPFDFSEGESELISGFNLEFGASSFVLLFLAEYGLILFFSGFLCVIFALSSFAYPLILCVFLFIRSVYPRFRYDYLMRLTWLRLLPVALSWLVALVFMC